MIHMSLQQAASAMQSLLQTSFELSFYGVAIDSRKVKQGELFIALHGPNFDGHNYLAQVREAGAVAAVVSHLVDDELPQILVDDTRLALGRLAAAWREEFAAPVIGITGSNGKTTVKEMCAAIMRQRGGCWFTQGNLNNDIGVPLTLFQLEPALHQSAVIEMGANHVGEIAYLTQLVKPDVAIVNNVGPAHIGEFGSLDNIAKGKAEIWQGLREGGVAVLNADDAYIEYWRGLTRELNTMTFASTASADVTLRAGSEQCRLDGQRFSNEFIIDTPSAELRVSLQLAGHHNVLNALAATALALAAGASVAHIQAGLAAVTPVAGRLYPLAGINQQLLLDDSYNANAASMEAALQVLAEMSGERVLVMGDMAELGDEAESTHVAIAEQARAAGVNALFTCGPLSQLAAEAFGQGAQSFVDCAALISALTLYMQAVNPASQVILFKGSRSARIDEVVHAVLAPLGGDDVTVRAAYPLAAGGV